VDLTDPAWGEMIAPAEASARIRASAAADPAFDWLEAVEAADGCLRLTAAFRVTKIPRPQDLVRLALGLGRPAFAMVREGFLLGPPQPRA